MNIIEFQLLDISSDDIETDDNDKEFVITLYGKTNITKTTIFGDFNENIVCHVYGFRPYFYLKYPTKDTGGNNILSSFIKNAFFTDNYLNIEHYIYKKEEILNCHELYRFRADDNGVEIKYKFIKLEFISYGNMKTAIRKIKNFCKFNQNSDEARIRAFINQTNEDPEYRFDCNLYESNIHPTLKFIHEYNIKTSGWLGAKVKNQIQDKRFNVDKEYKITCPDIITGKISERKDINKFIIASFDIECDSSHGDFPNPIKDLRKLCIEITDCYKIYGFADIKFIFKKAFDDGHRVKYESDKSFADIISPVYSTNTYCPESLEKILGKHQKEIDILLKESLLNSKNRENCVKCLTTILSKINSVKKDNNGKPMKINVKGDPIIQIGIVFHRYGDTEPYNRSIVVIGSEYRKDEEICDDLENMDENNIKIYRCSGEKNLLLKFKDLMLKHNPDYITGYNIFGFDFDYIIKRVDVLFKCDKCKWNNWTRSFDHGFRCEKHAFYRLGRMMKDSNLDYEPTINLDNYDYSKNKKVDEGYHQHNTKKCKEITKRLGGFNDDPNNEEKDFMQNILKYIHMDGRIIFDVQNEVKKGTSLDSYKLDNVAAHFMKGTILSKIRFKSFGHTRIKTNNIGNLKENDYISILITTKYGDIKYNNNEKFKILSIEGDNGRWWMISISGVIKNYDNDTENFIKAEWCLNKDDVPPQELFRLHKYGGPSGRAKIAKYCLMDCELCIYLLLLLDFIPNNMGMSNVCWVPQSYIFLRGQGIKVQSLVTKSCGDNKIRVPTLKQFNEDECDNSGFEGAIVLDPDTGIYLNDPIAVLDYASLYPTSINEKNLSHNTYLGEYELIKDKIENFGWKEGDDYNRIKYYDYEYINKPGTSIIEKIAVYSDENDENGTKKQKEIDCVFLTEKKKKGIIPLVVSELLNARKATKKLLKNEKDENKKKVLDGYQLAYKLTANSVYGQLGAKTSSISFKKIAACTTAIGRERIYDAKRIVTHWTEQDIWKNNIKESEFYDGVTDISSEVVYGDTDSIFVKFIIEKGIGNRLSGKDALPICIQCGKDSGIYITEQLHIEDKKPQDLEYEKTFWPFILISKKRYTGEKYEFTADEIPKRTSMGLVTKRRDNAPIVKYVFGNLINKLMYDKDLNKTIKWLEYILKNIIDGKEHISQFILSKTLNSYYKNPGSIAHKVLADRIGERDPGNKPKANDRIPYAYIDVGPEKEFVRFKKAYEWKGTGKFKQVKKQVENGTFYKKDVIEDLGVTKTGKPKTRKIKVDNTDKPKYDTIFEDGEEIMEKIETQGEPVWKNKVILQGNRIEHPEFIKQNNKKIDYKFYISNQIMNPVKQVLDITMNPDDTKSLFDKFIK